MKFKQFINEASVGEKPKYESHEMNNAVDLFLTHCKDALWMIEDNTPLYRGDKSLLGGTADIKTIDPTQTERKSTNALNHYTVLMDNLPSWVDYPKRSRSLICSTGKDYAAAYNNGKPAFRVIPFDSVKIGVCPGKDLWDVTLFGDNEVSINKVSSIINQLGIEPNWQSMLEFDQNAINMNTEKTNHLIHVLKFYGLATKYTTKFKTSFIDTLDNEMEPDYLGFDVLTTSTLQAKIKSRLPRDNEVWVGGKCIIVPGHQIWDDFRNAILERVK